MKKILIVVESIDVEDSSGSKANVALIQNLIKSGFHVKVYHYTRKNIQLKGTTCIPIKENRRSFLFLLSRMERYVRYKTNIPINKYVESVFGFSFTLFNDRNSIVSELRKISDFEPDYVLTLSKGGSFRPHHALLQIPKWHDRWMAYIHDPYPMHSYPRPYDWVEPGHQKKRKFFLKVAEKAKYAAYPSKLLAEWMESYFPPIRGKAVIIPHQISDDSRNQTALPAFFKKDFFTIAHAGALMSARNPMSLLNAFKRFLLKNPESGSHSQLLFLGDKSKYTPAFQAFKEEVPQFYSSDAYLPYASVQAVQQAASVNVILEAKGPISPFLPGKFPHCIQAEKPILLLGPYYSESRRLLGEDHEFWAEIDDEERIFELINKLYALWSENSMDANLKYTGLKDYLSEKFLSKVFLNKKITFGKSFQD